MRSIADRSRAHLLGVLRERLRGADLDAGGDPLVVGIRHEGMICAARRRSLAGGRCWGATLAPEPAFAELGSRKSAWGQRRTSGGGQPTPGERLLYALGQLYRQWRVRATLTPPGEVDVVAVAKMLDVWRDVEFVQDEEEEEEEEEGRQQHFHFPVAPRS